MFGEVTRMTFSPATCRSTWTPHRRSTGHGPDDPVGVADLLGGEPLPRHHLEDRAVGTDADAFTAPGAPRLVGITVGADYDFGVLAPEPHVEHADDLDVLARPHAARAQDAGDMSWRIIGFARLLSASVLTHRSLRAKQLFAARTISPSVG